MITALKWITTKLLIVLYLAATMAWLMIILSTAVLPKDNFIRPIVIEALGVDDDFVARPRAEPETVESFDDLLYSDYFYNYYFGSTLVVMVGMFTLTKSRSLLEIYLLIQAYMLPRARGDKWGKVVGKDHKPIPFTVVRILQQEGNQARYLNQTVADLDGRYRLFLGKPGNYVLEVSAPGYVIYRQKLDSSSIGRSNTITDTITLEKESEASEPSSRYVFFVKVRPFLMKLLTGYVYWLAASTFIVSIYSLIMHTNPVSIAGFVFYTYPAVWNTFVLLERRRFNPGKVLNRITKQPINNVNFQLFLPNDKMISVFSDPNGIIKVDTDPGDYVARVFRPGYKIKYDASGVVEVNINKDGYMDRNIYLEPIGDPDNIKQESLQTPFG